MSIDTSLADPISTLSPWEQTKARLFAIREVEADITRRELAAQPVKERTAADALADIQRYTTWLTVPAVQAGGALKGDIEAKLAGARAELGRMRRTGGAK